MLPQIDTAGFLLAIEELLGRRVRNGFVLLIFFGIGFGILKFLWAEGVAPVIGALAPLIGALGSMQMPAVSITTEGVLSFAVTALIPFAGAWLGGRLFNKAEEARLLTLTARVQELQAARTTGQGSLSLAFAPNPPYKLESLKWYRVGVRNDPDADTAFDVKVRLLDVTPQPPFLREELLPSRLGWKGGGAMQNIAPGQERHADVLRYQLMNLDENDEERIIAQFWVDEGPAVGGLTPGEEYLLRIQVTSVNSPTVTGHYKLRADGGNVRFTPTAVTKP